MAFVVRSQRKINLTSLNSTNIGPGEYEDDEMKFEARLVHDINNRYSRMTSTILKQEIPFNTTSPKDLPYKFEDTPGPGTYYVSPSENNKNLSFEKNPSSNNEIVFVEENGVFFPKFRNDAKGFLSSVQRFKRPTSLLGANLGPGCYNIYNEKNNIKNNQKKNSFKNLEKGRISKSPKETKEGFVKTIPDKSQGNYKMIEGAITEIKKTDNYDELVGPGRYNIRPSWDANVLNWSLSKKNKNKFKSERVELEKKTLTNISNTLNNSTNYSVSNNNKSKYSKSLSNKTYNDNLKKCSISDMTMKQRKIIFNTALKLREEEHLNNLAKIKAYKEMVTDVKYKDTPGPGFYESKILKEPKINDYKKQNFGSNLPKFFKVDSTNKIVGPATYFQEKNKYEPKIETITHLKKPEKKIEENIDVGVFLKNFRNKNVNKLPGPGEYNLEKDFLKKKVSNINSFGVLSERFTKPDDKNINKESNINNETTGEMYKRYIKNVEEQIKHINENKKPNIYEQEIAEQRERMRRRKNMKEEYPSVGSYSPEIYNSIKYDVLSKVNPYRNKLAPFDTMGPRFNNQFKFKKESGGTPGPGEYEPDTNFNSLNSTSKRNRNNFGLERQKKCSSVVSSEEPGPGYYGDNNPNLWDKKTFNVLFLGNQQKES